MKPKRATLLRRVRGWLPAGVLLLAAACASGAPPGEAPAGVLAGEPPAGMAPIVDSVPLLLDPAFDTVRAGRFDRGRMWTLDELPLAYLDETYGFVPDSAWLRQARLSALRIPGCSAAFVSATGLALTNHHCVRDALQQLSEDGEDLLRDGLFARTAGEERRIEDFTADRLVAIHDVTDEVSRRIALAPASLRDQRREEIQREVGARVSEAYGGEGAGIAVEMVTLYAGARITAYVYRRYRDVRLVMAPELAAAYFGGDTDNFTYPRHTLDFALLRVYDERGNAVAPESWLRWSSAGAQEGDLTFVIGSPGPTTRQETLAQLLFRRDVSDRAVLDFVSRRSRIFEEFVRSDPARARELGIENARFELANSLKSYQGRVAGLHDPLILARLRDGEAQLQRAIEADSSLAAEYGDLLARMSDLQRRRRQSAAGYSFLALGSSEFESSTLTRALLAYQYANALRQAQPVRVRNEMRAQILAVGSKPAALEEALIQDRLQSFVDAYGAASELARAALDGRSPEGAATHLLQTSVFADSARTAETIASGSVPMDDPALRVVQAYAPTLGRFEQQRARADQEEALLAERVGRMRYAVHGSAVPPDATLSLRLADGVVAAPVGSGAPAPAHTTIAGMYALFEANRSRFSPPEASPWHLPARWSPPPAGLAPDTPLNFVTTADIAGGSSGSPVVSRTLELLGVVFDGNLESLPGSYIFRPEVHRAIAVDARAILHALDVVYEMDALLAELLGPAPVGAASPP